MKPPVSTANTTIPAQPPLIGGVRVHADAKGRLNLSDLHRASSGQKRHNPADWLLSLHAQAIVTALSVASEQEAKPVPPVSTKKCAPHTGGGIYAHRELAYAYAEWISPEFRDTVVRAFDAQAIRPPAITSPEISRLELLQSALSAEEERLALEETAGLFVNKSGTAGQIADTQDLMGVSSAAKALRVNPPVLANLLRKRRWIGGVSEEDEFARRDKIRLGYLAHKAALATRRKDGSDNVAEEVMVTSKGLDRLDLLLRRKREARRK